MFLYWALDTLSSAVGVSSNVRGLISLDVACSYRHALPDGATPNPTQIDAKRSTGVAPKRCNGRLTPIKGSIFTGRFKFTKRALAALPPPPNGRVYHQDEGQDNLSLCVTASGKKTFYRVGRIDGAPVRIKIGRFPDLSVEQARTRAREIAGDIAPPAEEEGRPHAAGRV